MLNYDELLQNQGRRLFLHVRTQRITFYYHRLYFLKGLFVSLVFGSVFLNFLRNFGGHEIHISIPNFGQNSHF